MLKFFAEKNMSSFCSAKATHIFSAKNIRILHIEVAKTVNENTLNELVKLTMLWTTGPWIFTLPSPPSIWFMCSGLFYLTLLTHCILNRLSHTTYWKGPISILGMSGYEIYIFLEKNGWTVCKQWKPWSDALFCGVWSGSALFAKYSFTGLPTTMG